MGVAADRQPADRGGAVGQLIVVSGTVGGFRHTLAMAYDEDLADRVRELVAAEPGLTEKRMFGGLAFLIGGHMAVSASGKGGLLLRVDPARTDEYVAPPHVGRFVMRGREMDGWLRVDAEAVDGGDRLARWVGVGVAYVRTLAPK